MPNYGTRSGYRTPDRGDDHNADLEPPSRELRPPVGYTITLDTTSGRYINPDAQWRYILPTIGSYD